MDARRTTSAEIKREIYGNDADGEVAVGADLRPAWMEKGGRYLQAPLADLITDAANRVTAASLAKFRNAINRIALTEGRPRDAGNVSNYSTWKELIHTTYFELPEFRKLIPQAIAQAEGFVPTKAFLDDPDYRITSVWLDGLMSPADDGARSSRIG